jgi:Mn2+/Fe2+ NRAMP family transporter
VVTGAADDDPSGIATYTQAGAQFGTGVLWTVFLTIPFMIGIQLVSARIGRQSGRGIAANLRLHTPRAFRLAIVGLLLVANTINIAVDIASMGEALQLVVGGLDFTLIDPMKALCWSAVVNGVVAMMILSGNPAVMGALPVRRKTRFFGLGAAGVMAVAMMLRDLLR